MDGLLLSNVWGEKMAGSGDSINTVATVIVERLLMSGETICSVEKPALAEIAATLKKKLGI